MLRIAVVDVDRGHEERHRAREQQQRDDRDRQQDEILRMDRVAERHHEQDQHRALEREVHERRADRGKREDRPREVHLLDEVGVVDHGPHRARRRRRVEVPREESRQQVDGKMRHVVVQHDREDEREHPEEDERVDHRPHGAEHRRRVLDLQLLADDVQEDLAEPPELPEPRPPVEAGRLGAADDDLGVGSGHGNPRVAPIGAGVPGV